jgi:hypothetical protein
MDKIEKIVSFYTTDFRRVGHSVYFDITDTLRIRIHCEDSFCDEISMALTLIVSNTMSSVIEQQFYTSIDDLAKIIEDLKSVDLM